LSARGETRDAELLKFGETFELAIPSQAWRQAFGPGFQEGVETRRAAPNPRAARGTV